MTWDEAAMNDLRRLHEKQLAFSEIGHLLGCSKNAAIGKARRMKLPGRDLSRAVRLSYVRGERKAPAPKAPSLRREPPVRPEPAGWKPMFVVAMPAASPTEVTRCDLASLRDDMCRFPLWGSDATSGFYCGGDAVFGLPYCSHHCAIAYTGRPRKAERAA